jgi:50S ribosomal subunit-associated GTPase HflX
MILIALQVQEKEMRILKAIAKLRSQRKHLRDERKKKEFPIVAVVGYTNAGALHVLNLLFINLFSQGKPV